MNEREIAAEVADIFALRADATGSEVENAAAHPNNYFRSAPLPNDATGFDDIERFDSAEASSIFSLMLESASEVRERCRAAVVDTLAKKWGDAAGARMLSYGAGIGSDTLYFADKCRAAFYFDMPSIASEFAAKRFMRQGVPITRITSTQTYGPEFDAIVALDVLERPLVALAQLDEMVRLTKYGGMLFLGDSFDIQDQTVPLQAPDRENVSNALDQLMTVRDCRRVCTLEEHIRVYVKGPAASVIVPIYNAYDHVCQLLDSIKNTTAGYPVDWVLVNDASPDPRLSALLRDFAASVDGSCRLVEHERNCGFLQSCNRAMDEAGTADVILLNSDTVLYDGWARKLLEAAYDDPEIGTATPLSNNASCYSMFQHVTPSNGLHSLLAEAELPSLPIPVGTGFCLYIKREVLDRVGLFDPTFGKGYGEETELCLRASAAGYRHVLATQVYVYHAGSASMVPANVIHQGQTTVEAHERIIAKRYPTFVPSVHQFIASGIIEATANDLSKRYVVRESSVRPAIAIVVHDHPLAEVIGGTTYHIRDLIQELEHEFLFYFLTPDANSIRITAYVDGITYSYTPSSTDYLRILTELNPSVLHIHHLLYFPSSFIDAVTEWQGQKIYTIHDFYGLCPQYNLVNYRQMYCGVPEPKECDRCAKKLFGTGYSTPAAQRRTFQRLIDSTSTVLAPSHSALAVFRKAISVPEEKVRILPHPMVPPNYDSGIKHLLAPPPKPAASMGEKGSSKSEIYIRPRHARDIGATHYATVDAMLKLKKARIRVGFIGYNSPHKGTALMQGIIAACADDPIAFVALGDIGQTTKGSKNVVTTGRFQREESVDLIKRYIVDVVVVTSIWPETFSYILSEAWTAGAAVIVGPLGAPAERVVETGAGMIAPDYRVQSFVTTLRQLVSEPDTLKELKLAASAVSPRTDYGEYRELYVRHAHHAPTTTRSFSSSVEKVTSAVVDLNQLPAVLWLVNLRKRLFPVGSAREKVYFWIHNRITHVYAGGITR